jgi:hypothetical protein
VLTRHICGKLYKQASFAEANVKWIEDLGLVELFLGYVALA